MSKRFTDPKERIGCAATQAARRTAVELLESRLLLSAATFTAPHSQHSTTVRWNNHNVQAAPGQWVVRVNNVGGKSIDDTRARLQTLLHKRRSDLTVVDIDAASGLALVQAPKSLKPTTVSRAISGVKGFKSIAPNYVYSISNAPNDPYLFRGGDPGQWPLLNFGQPVNGVPGSGGADIKALGAWDLTTGDGNVVVAVLDTGVQYTHPDLQENIWTNPGEIAGNSIDDDNDGFVDDVHGYDFANSDANPDDDHGHGTHVAGIIAATGNNGQGITGVAWNAKILPVKMLDQNGFTDSFAAISAVNYVTHLRRDVGVNVRVINASWSGLDYDTNLQTAIANAGEAGILFVAAAGNSGTPNPEYPAGFGLPNEISVAATDNRDNLAPFSSFGQSVQIAAPGVDVLSTVPTTGAYSDPSGYMQLSGTSMAAPHVAGVAVLAFSLANGGTVDDVRNAILQSADINFQNPLQIGQPGGFPGAGGRLNAYAALNQLGLQVTGSTPYAGALITTTPPKSFDIHFSHPIAPSSLQPADLTVNGIPATGVSLDESVGTIATFTYATSPVTSTGLQTMAIAEGAINRSSDGFAIRAWSATFRNGGTSFDIVSTTPAVGSDVAAPMTTLRLTFTSPIWNPSLQVADLILSSGTVMGVQTVDTTTVQYTLSGLTSAGTLSVHLPAGQISDSTGRTNADFVATYHLSQPNDALATSLLPVAPLSSAIYRGTTTGSIGSGPATDRYPILLDPAQSLAVTVKPTTTSTLRPAVSVLDGNGAIVGSATAAVAGASVVIPVVSASSGGAYTVVVGSADTSASSVGGSYVIDVAVNSLFEAEGRGGSANDTRSAAENIDAAFTAPAGIRRAAVMGSLPGAGASGQDWFAVTLTAGESPSIAGLLQTPGGNLRLNLYNAAGTLLAGGTEWSNGQAITGFSAPSAGTYYIRASGAGGDYSFVVTDGAFDLEPNNAFDAATNLGGRRGAIGYVSGTSPSFFREVEKNDDGIVGLSLTDLALANDLSGSFSHFTGQDGFYRAQVFGTISAGNDGDWDVYRFYAQPGDSAAFEMNTMGGGGVLNPYLRLVDNTGKILATDDDSAGNQSDSRIVYNAFAYSGDYYVIADSFANATQPDYSLVVGLTTPQLQTTAGPDSYRVNLAEGQTIQVRTSTPGDGPGAIVNTLDPSIQIRGLDGNISATDSNSAADGRNALLNYTAIYAGSYVVSVVAEGMTAGTYVLSISDPAPAVGAPGIPDLAAVSDTGLLSDDNVTRLNNLPGTTLQYDVPGTTPGATVMLYADGDPTPIGSATASGTTTTIITNGTHKLWEGAHSIIARQMPAGGGALSAASPFASLRVDTESPDPATGAPDLRASSDTGLSASDNITRDVTPTLDFPVPSGSYFSVFRNGIPVGGTFGPGASYTSTELADGDYDFAVAVTDLAGNASAISSPLHITIDATAPAAPGISDLQAASDSGLLTDDNLTNAVNPTFDIAGVSAGSFVRLYRGIIQVSADYAGVPVTTNVRQPDGTWGYFARAVDAAGNTSDAGPALNVTIDTLAWSPAVSGALDPTFGGTGKVLKDFSPYGEQINDLLLLPDNKILAAGFIADADGLQRFMMSRFNTDGSLDPTFGVGGIQTTSILMASMINQVLLQPDGKILVSVDGIFARLAVRARRGEDGRRALFRRRRP